MKLSVRNLLISLGLAFSIYLAIRGLMWTKPIVSPAIMIVVSVFLFLLTLICLFAEPRIPRQTTDAPLTAGSRGPTVLPVWGAVLAVVAAFIIPSAVALAAGPENRTAPYATAYLGAVGAVLTIVTVRRRAPFAWAGAAALAIGSIVWMGPLSALAQGLTGSVMWIAMAQFLLGSLDRAARDTVRLVELQRAAVSWQSAQDARRRERRLRVQFALNVAGPVLSRIIETDGVLTAEERLRAHIAEGSLRDELRGAKLMDERVRSELDAARLRGINVTVFDEGGLDALDSRTLDGIRGELADVINEASSERLIIRTVRGSDLAVTVVGRSGADDGSGDDVDVDLWHEISRSRPASE